MTIYQIRQCSTPACRFRFPMRSDEPLGNRCPQCGGQTAVIHEISDEGEPGHTQPNDSKPVLCALLDNVRSIFNVGSIFRSADGAAFQHLYLCGFTPTPAQRKLAKTALGAEQSIAWSHHNNAVDLVQNELAAKYVLWALEEGENAEPLFDVTTPTRPILLMVGNEVAGLDPDLLALCERKLAIPMRGRKRSLNVATAFGIAAVIVSEHAANDKRLMADY